MNDKDVVIKGLECCRHSFCCDCPYEKYSENCTDKLITEAHRFVKHQQEDIEKLAAQNVKIKKCFTIEFDDDKLKKIVKKTVDKITIDIKQAENEAIREFAEELIINLDGDIEAYANAGHGLNIYEWLKYYLVSKGAIKAEKEMTGGEP